MDVINTDKIFIVDDAFPEWFQLFIEKKSSTVPWEFRQRVHSPTYTEATLSYFCHQNTHTDIVDTQGIVDVMHDALTADLIPRVVPNVKITGFFGMRWNGTIKGHRPSIHRDSHDDMHDNPTQWTMVYFVNHSDGDLIFYDDDKTTEIKRCEYKRGRAVIFPSNIYHGATDPVGNNLRITFAAQYYMHQERV